MLIIYPSALVNFSIYYAVKILEALCGDFLMYIEREKRLLDELDDELKTEESQTFQFPNTVPRIDLFVLSR